MATGMVRIVSATPPHCPRADPLVVDVARASEGPDQLRGERAGDVAARLERLLALVEGHADVSSREGDDLRHLAHRCELHAGGGVDEVEGGGELAGEALGRLPEESRR